MGTNVLSKREVVGSISQVHLAFQLGGAFLAPAFSSGGARAARRVCVVRRMKKKIRGVQDSAARDPRVVLSRVLEVVCDARSSHR